MSCAFTLAHYCELLASVRSGGYRFAFFDGLPGEGDVLLRHDVDLSLDAALRLAELETDAGASATYFLMTESVFYNLASTEGVATIARLRELGHRVGLHAVYPAARLDDRFDPVVAWHNPDPAYMTMPVDGAVNVMQEGYFAPSTYRSDSNQRWRSGCPHEEPAGGCLPVAPAPDPSRDLGLSGGARWARRCTRCSTPSASVGSGSSRRTASTSRERHATCPLRDSSTLPVGGWIRHRAP